MLSLEEWWRDCEEPQLNACGALQRVLKRRTWEQNYIVLPECCSQGIEGMERKCSNNSNLGEKMESGRRGDGSCLGKIYCCGV